MKSIFRFLLFFVIAIASFSTNIYAQTNNKQRMTREQLAETQAKYIAKEIAMDGNTAEKFIKTFSQFQQEIWALGPRLPKSSINNSETETEQTLKERFERSQKILDLRKKYYTEYSKFLTSKQIERVYELEKKMMDRLSRQSQKKGNRK